MPQIEGPVQVARRSDMSTSTTASTRCLASSEECTLYRSGDTPTQTACLWLQVEIDYKSECMAGQTVESLGSSTGSEDTNGSGVLRCNLEAALHILW